MEWGGSMTSNLMKVLQYVPKGTEKDRIVQVECNQICSEQNGQKLSGPKAPKDLIFIDFSISEQSNQFPSYDVTVLKLSSFIQNVVNSRQLPKIDAATFGPPRVLIKMDIEGSEYQVLSDLIYSQILDKIDAIFIELHENPHREEFKSFVKSSTIWSNLVKKATTKLIIHDDESYHDSKFPLPKCE